MFTNVKQVNLKKAIHRSEDMHWYHWQCFLCDFSHKHISLSILQTFLRNHHFYWDENNIPYVWTQIQYAFNIVTNGIVKLCFCIRVRLHEISFRLKVSIWCSVNSLLVFTCIGAKWNSNWYGFHIGHFDRNEISNQYEIFMWTKFTWSEMSKRRLVG